MSQLRMFVCCLFVFSAMPVAVSAQNSVNACRDACGAWLLSSNSNACNQCATEVTACDGLTPQQMDQVMVALRRNLQRATQSCQASQPAPAPPTITPPPAPTPAPAPAPAASRLVVECLGPDGTPFPPTGSGYRSHCPCPEGTLGVSGSRFARPVGERGGRGVLLRITYCSPLSGHAPALAQAPTEEVPGEEAAPSPEEVPGEEAATEPEVPSEEAAPAGNIEVAVAPVTETAEDYVEARLSQRVEDLEETTDDLATRVTTLERAAPSGSEDHAELESEIGNTQDMVQAVSRRTDAFQRCLEGRTQPSARRRFEDEIDCRAVRRQVTQLVPGRATFGFRVALTPGVGFVTVAQGSSLPPLWMALELSPSFRFADTWTFELGAALGYAAGQDQVPDGVQANFRMGFLGVAHESLSLGFGVAAHLRFQSADYLRNVLLGPYVEGLVHAPFEEVDFVGGLRLVVGLGVRSDVNSATAVADGALLLVLGVAYHGPR